MTSINSLENIRKAQIEEHSTKHPVECKNVKVMKDWRTVPD